MNNTIDNNLAHLVLKKRETYKKIEDLTMQSQKILEQRLLDLHKRFYEFKDRCETTEHLDEKIEELVALKTELKEIQKDARQYLPQLLFSKLNLPDLHFIKMLNLSDNSEDYTDLLTIIKNNPNEAAIDLIEFLKTQTGFECVHKTKINETDSQSYETYANFFGGVLGIENVNTILKSIKAEEIGCLLTYVLSGKHINDVQFIQDKNWKEEEKFAYIFECAKKSDQEYVVTELSNYTHVKGHLQTKTRQNLRGRNRIDTTMVTDDHIWITNSTSSSLSEQQNQSFLNYYVAVLKTSKTKTEKNKSNPLWEKEICPTYFMSGLFPEKVEQPGGLKKDFTGYIENAQLSLSEKRSLSQSIFLGLLGSCQSREEMVITFLHNPIIAGCNTLDLFAEHLEITEKFKKITVENYQDTMKDIEVELKNFLSKKVKLSCQSIEKLIESNVSNNNMKGYTLETNDVFHAVLKNVLQVVKSLNVLQFSNEEKEDLLASMDRVFQLHTKVNNNNLKQQLKEWRSVLLCFQAEACQHDESIASQLKQLFTTQELNLSSSGFKL